MYLWLDATYLKVRDQGRVVSKAAVVAVGAHELGQREVLGLALGRGESHEFWKGFLRNLTRRGLTGVQRVISDAHEGRDAHHGLKSAIAQVLSTSWQRCRVHFMRSALKHVPQGQRQMVAAAIRTAFVQEDLTQARAQWRETADKLRGRFPKLAELIDEAEEDVLAFIHLPKEHWPQVASTNPLERLNKEIKRRTRVVEIFLNDAARSPSWGRCSSEQSDEWQVTRRYMSQESLQRAFQAEAEPDRRRIATRDAASAKHSGSPSR